MKHFTFLFVLLLCTVSMNAAEIFRQDSIYERVYQNLLTGAPNVNDPSSGSDLNIMGDESDANFVRQLFNFEELTSDEAYCHWSDTYLQEANNNLVSTGNPQLYGLWLRIYKGIDLCNYFLEQTASLTDATTITQRASVRVMRAFYYSYALSLFGNPPLTTSTSDKGKQVGREGLFNFLIDELKDAEPSVPDAQAFTSADAGYGHVTKGVAWMLMARLYLNAEVYTGTPHWEDAAAYAKKIIDSGAYQLSMTAVNGWSGYQQLFMGDNGESAAAKEMILPIYVDGAGANSWSALFFLAAMSNGLEYIHPDEETMGIGASQTWAGHSSRKPLIDRILPNANLPEVHAYAMPEKAGDDRAIIENYPTKYDDSYKTEFGLSPYLTKYNNFHSDGTAAHGTTFADTDLPLMRYAEALMTYAEAEFRLGNTAVALEYINMVRSRSHAAKLTSLTLKDIEDEWSREFYYEGRRRTDMIRFNTLTGKSFRRLLPIPEYVMRLQPDLIQNPGYVATDLKDVKLIQPSFVNEAIKLDSIIGLSFAWHTVTQGEADDTYALAIGKDKDNCQLFTSYEDTTTIISTYDLQKIMQNYFPDSKEADVKVYCIAYFNASKCSTDSVTLHLVAPAKISNPWFMLIGGKWNNTVEGIGESIFPLVYGDNIDYYQSGDGFQFVKNFSWEDSWGSTDGSIYNLTQNVIRSSIYIDKDGWYNVHMTTYTPVITPVTDYVETTYKAVTLSTGLQTITLSPMRNRDHEAVFFAKFTLDSESKLSVNADDVSLAKDVIKEAGTYYVFVNTQSKTCMIFKADGSDFIPSQSNHDIVNTLEPIPATGMGTIELGEGVDSVQVVNIGRINSGDKVSNIVLVVNGRQIRLSDDGRCAVSAIKGIVSAEVRFYADYQSGDLITRRWSDYFDLSTKTAPSATMVTSDGKSYGMASGADGIMGYGYLSGTVTVNHGNRSWTETVSQPGFYKAIISTTTNSDGTTSESLAFTKISSVSMIGDFNNWDGDEPLTYNAADNIWEGTLTLSSAIRYMKIRANNAWDLNWGFSADALSGTLVENGSSNLTISSSGTYQVTVILTYPGDSRYSISSTSTGIIAPAPADGPAKIYDLNGIEVKHPKSGVYIVRKNGQVRKMIIK